MATIVWEDGGAIVGEPQSPVSDEAALEAMRNADWVGIDAPFGWPEAIVSALPAFADRGVWPHAGNEQLRFRLTDIYVHERTRMWPLSVSSDRIAVPAWRCARLLAEDSQGNVDRLGGNRIVEVYPGAALTLWGFERRGYKSSGYARRRLRERESRKRLIQRLGARGSGWLDLSAASRICIESDHALDAVLAALVARAAAQGVTAKPPADQLHTIRREGWIQLPAPDSFEKLVGSPAVPSCDEDSGP